MLVIANGAFKSGSTWLFHVLRDMTGYRPVPAAYCNPAWKHPSILPQQLPALLETVDLARHNFLVKNHLEAPEQRILLLAHPDVRVIDIRRDLRDVVVSAYYHMQNFQNYESSFECYYWTHGRRIADKVCRYHELWSPVPDRVYVSAYERLKTAFHDECRSLGEFLGLSLSDRRIAAVAESTAFETRRRKQQNANGKPAFFRGGRIGDWKVHLSPQMLADLERIEQTRLSPLPWNVRGRNLVRAMLRRWRSIPNE